MTAPLVPTASGPVRGSTDDGIHVFKGIPYGAPPVGARRWQAPVPPEPWSEPFDATEFGPVAPQNPSMLESMLGAEEVAWDEDCLRLNVWTPALPDDGGEPLPVMVWIHGGAFVFGSGATPWYDGRHLARRGAVVVTINYRLGALGYLHLADLGEGFEHSGNAGLLDQVAALEWVRDNIEAFGGDPANVTVFGESAGAMSVGMLLATPRARGLFRRAILQSGAASTVDTAERSTEVAAKFLAAVGCTADELRDVPVADLLAAQTAIGGPLEEGLAFTPTIDGDVVPDHPLRLIQGGSAAEVDVLIGTNGDEMTMFVLLEPAMGQLTPEEVERRIDAHFALHEVPAGLGGETYRQRLGPDASAVDLVGAVMADHTFRIPAIRIAEAQAANGRPARMYLFTYESPAFGGLLKSSHALEIPFAFDNLDAPGIPAFVGEPGEGHQRLATTMGDAWVAFARDGVPAAPGLPEWPAYDPDRRATMRLDIDAVEVVDDPRGAERALWDGIDPGPAVDAGA